MAEQEGLLEHHGHFLIVLGGDPDVAGMLIEQVQVVLASVEAEGQRALRRPKELFHARVETFFVHLQPVQAQAAELAAEMTRRHLPIVLLPPRCDADLLGHIVSVVSLDLQGICGIHATSFVHSNGAFDSVESG